MEISINDEVAECRSTGDFADKLGEIDRLEQAEVWLNVAGGPLICLLKSEENAFMVYLREEGDSGFHSLGDAARAGTFNFRLANGRFDEYPSAWCIEPESAYKALAYFFENDGEKPPFVSWIED